MSPLTQSKLLRVLQEKTFERLGGNETIHTDVRVLAATNANLQAAVSTGQFRLDLFYRLSVFTIHLPPLRERGDDLQLLIGHYLPRFNRELGKDVQGVSPEALATLRRYPWPGNVRELQSVLKQALLQTAGPVLVPDFLSASVLGVSGAAVKTEELHPESRLDQFIETRLQAGTQELYAEALERLERLLLTRVLRHTAGNQLQAAKILGITRGSLRSKIRELGIRIDRTVSSGEEDEG
jgi:two-component system nitrogen regulation response regulator GlnG